MDIINWTIEVYNEQDYLAGELIIPKARKSFWKDKVQFNQNEIDPYWCVYHTWTWCIADEQKFDYKSFLLKCKSNKYDYWFVDWKGMYVYKGCDMVRHLWNKENPEDQIITHRVAINSDTFFEALNKGYSIHTGYRGNKKYNEDAYDWELNGTEFGPATYWHSIRITKKGDEYVVDNYIGLVEHNIYKIDDLKKLVKNRVFFNSWYIYLFKNDIMKEQNPDIALIEKAINEWITKETSLLDDVKAGKYHPELRNLIRIMRVKEKLEQEIKNCCKK